MRILTTIIAAAILATNALAHEGEHHPEGPGLFGQPPEYIHVLLNPLPFYGLAIGVLALAAGLLARSRSARILGLSLVILTSASAWPVFHYGQNAYERVRKISDEQGQLWLDDHMERAEKFIYAFYATALLGIAALASVKKLPKTATLLSLATLAAGLASLGIGGWISRAGGNIRHPEFRHSPALTNKSPAHTHNHEEAGNERTNRESK